MQGTHIPVLTILIGFPILGCLGLFFIRRPQHVRVFSLVISLVELLLATPLLGFRLDTPDFQFVELLPWAPAWGITYHLGLDGISVLMVGLTLIIFPLCILCSWSYISQRIKEFHFCLLLLSSACVGVFSALDLVLFYLFWEAVLIPMYLLIAVWGGPQRQYASLKFVLYTVAGSALLLVALIAFRVEGGTFSVPELMTRSFAYNFQCWTFLIMALAFAVKVPMFPFHTWLPAAHVEAPAAGSMILASILLKMGTYGFLRFCLPLAPAASQTFAPLMIAVSIASILYGGAVALGQTDMKKIIAYSSIGHMGFVTLGIFALNLRGSQGALFQMLNHGITTGGLFMMVGLIYERSHSREVTDNQGLGKYLPTFMGFWGLMAFSSFAFPGTNNFVGEFLVLTAAFERHLWVGALTVPGALLAAAYMLRLTQKMAWGEPPSPKGWQDLRIREWVSLLPLAFLVLYIGLAPTLFFKVMNPTLTHLITGIKGQAISAEVSLSTRPGTLTKPVIATQLRGRRGK